MPLTQQLKNTIKAPVELLASRLGPHRFQRQEKLWSLMYHRILPKSDSRYAYEEPGMIVEPETFRHHLRQLKQLFTIMPLSEWIDKQQSGQSIPTNACCITFDDGWRDNYEYAYPILQQEQVPATLFAVSHLLGSQQQFWPNHVAQLLNTYTPEQLRQLDWLSPYLKKSTHHETPKETLSQVIHQLKQHSDHVIYQWIKNSQQLPLPKPTKAPLMNWQQIKAMNASGLIEIGSHTCHHYRLQEGLDPDILESEIVTSQQRLQDELGKPVKLFCYPNGDISPLALKTVKRHYKAAVTTKRGINIAANTDIHQLARIGIHQDGTNTATKLQAKMANWF